MISSNEQAEALKTSAVGNPSNAAGLLDDAFMSQFALVYPQDSCYQSAIDDWFLSNFTNDLNTFPDSTFTSGDFSRAVKDAFHQKSSASDNLHLGQAADATYDSQVIENCFDGQGINRNVPHLPSIEQVLYDLVQPEGRTSPNVRKVVHETSQSDSLQSLQNGTSLYEPPRFESLDEECKALLRSPQYVRDFEKLFGFPPDSQCEDLVDGLTAINSAENGPIGLSQGVISEVYNSKLISNSLLHPYDDKGRVQPHTTNQLTPVKLVPVKRPLLPTKIAKTQRKEPLNSRRANMESIDPSQYYEKLPEAPRSWSPPNTNGMSIFQYDEYGELYPNDRFSPEQIYQYLFHHPLNYDENGNYDIANSKLILWIQTTPADSGKRYPYIGSSKCRFQNCPAPRNTIRKGFFRVAFDETTSTGRQTDPYYCAGFVHLFCLEKFCDFPLICQKFNVLPDQRSLPEGRNKMAIARDHPEMSDVVNTFMQSSHTPIPWDYEETLCFQLTSKYLELEPSARKGLRVARGGNHIEMHKGDIDRYVEGERHKVARQRVSRRAPKRKRESEDEEEVIEKSTEKDIPPAKRRYRFR